MIEPLIIRDFSGNTGGFRFEKSVKGVVADFWVYDGDPEGVRLVREDVQAIRDWADDVLAAVEGES